MTKVTIIGAGSVGSTIAYTLAVQGIASEIVMIDINNDKASGEALDIRQGTPFCAPVTIYAGTYRDAVDSDMVILTSGIARKPGQSRLDLAQTNVDIVKSIIPQITTFAPDATYIIVSNPVDILTYVWCKLSELPENKIIGTGTILDTSRLRARISETYSINQQNVHAYVFGEHGDTSARVIQRKGATYYAIALSTCHIVKCLIDGMDTTVTVSSMMHGEYGLYDVCLSTLNIIGRDGLRGKLLPTLTEEENALLHKSADSLREVIRGLSI